jgi:hypothetical protein
MNIHLLMKSLLGESRPADGKLLELKVGQVIQGVVLQLLAEQEALLQIAGVPVRVKLQTPLRQGQTTMLQVQPESNAGLVVLKPLNNSDVPIADESLSGILNHLSVKDLSVHRELVQQLHLNHIPFTKENVQRFTRLTQSVPEGIHPQERIQAGIIASQRGLPITESTVSALHETLFGKPFHRILNELAEQAADALRSERLDSPRQQQMSQLIGIIKQIVAASSEVHAYKEPKPSINVHVQPEYINKPSIIAEHQRRTNQNSVEHQGEPSDLVISRSSTHAPKSEPPVASWLPDLLKSLGLQYENEFSRLSLLSSFHLNDEVQETDASPEATLKGVLLRLMTDGSDFEALPHKLKETIQQAVQQVTGQQLLMISDKTSVFSYITLFIPISNNDGQQTAAIHIQSRKGARGEMDTDNCRLLFDLHMHALGEVMVDVHIVNRMISLKLHNNHPYIADIIDSNRMEISSALERAGYQLSSLKHTAFIKNGADEPISELRRPEHINTIVSKYKTKPYKGVDFKV